MNRNATQDQPLRDFFRLLRRQGIWIVASVVIAVGASIAYSSRQTDVYEASSAIQFNDISQDLNALGTPVAPPTDPAKGAAANAKIITSDPVIEDVTKAVNRSAGGGGGKSKGSADRVTETEVRDSVETAVDPDTNLVTIQTHSGEAPLAAQLANAFAQQTKITVTRAERERLMDAADRLEETIKDEKKSSVTRSITTQRISELRSLATFARPVVVASRARVPESPASPRPLRNALLAGLLGLILGALIAFLRDSLDRRLSDAHEIQHQLEIPMVGYVEADALGGVGFSRNGGGDPDQGIEGFRILRSNVEFLAPERTVKTLAVTSPVAQEGKSTVAAGLASASALAGKQVLLVECDLRRPVFAERFGLPAQPGLTDWAAGQVPPGEIVQQVQVERTTSGGTNGAKAQPELTRARPLNVIVAGSWVPRPAELLGSDRFQGFLEQVSSVYEMVILDCAPLLPVGDTLELIPQVDAALVCIRLDQTTQEQALAAKGAIEHFPSRPIGVVITGVRPGREGYYYGYYSSPSRRPSIVAAPAEPAQPSNSAL
jgi:non-specific protein-tyrosine kinase